MELAGSDLPQDGLFIAQHPARIDLKADSPSAFFPDGSIILLHHIVPRRLFRRNGRKLDRVLLSSAVEQKREREQTETAE